MIDLILSLFGGAGGTLAGIGAAVAAVLGALLAARRSGSKSTEIKADNAKLRREAQALEDQLRMRDESAQIDREIADMTLEEKREAMKKWKEK